MHASLACLRSVSVRSARQQVRGLAVFSWGNGDSGQLGLPSTALAQELETYGKSAYTPQALGFTTRKLRDASTSAAHSAFIDSDGCLWTCGLGSDGQLGLGAIESSWEPLIVPAIANVRAVACGNRHTLALTEDGRLFGFGSNKFGQLGTDCGNFADEPVPITTLEDAGEKIISISAGDDFSAAVSESGSVFTWGSGTLGRLGHGSDRSTSPSFVRFILGESVSCEPTPRLVRSLKGEIFSRVFCGKHHVVAVTKTGKAFAWGSGRHYQLGTGSTQDEYSPVESLVELWNEKIVKVSPGGMHSLILCASGRLYSIGHNEAGCLGMGYEDASVRSSEIPFHVSSIVYASDIAAGWHISAAVVHAQSNVKQNKEREILTWGSGSAGALGVGDPVDHWVPVGTGVDCNAVAIGSGGTHVLAFDRE